MVIAVAPAREQATAEAALGRGEEHLEVLAGNRVFGLPTEARPARPQQVGRHRVRRGVEGSQPARRVQIHRQRYLLQGLGRIALGAQDVSIAVQPAGGRQHLFVL